MPATVGDVLDHATARPAARAGPAAASATSAPSSHDTSAGRISVAIVPGGRGGRDRLGRVGRDVGRATATGAPSRRPCRRRASMSDSSGASSRLCERAWSPTTLTSGVRPRRALCRLASPLPRPGPEVQQRRRRAAGHPRVAVGRAGGHALEEREDGAHVGDVVQRGDEVHLRRAGVGEADVHARVDQRPDQCLCAVHLGTLARGSDGGDPALRTPAPASPTAATGRTSPTTTTGPP